MASINIAALVNLLGFTIGLALYAMLLLMVLLRHPSRASRSASIGGIFQVSRLPFATAVLGLLWNIGALVIYGLRDLGVDEPLPLISAPSFAALGFLPAVVVHSTLRDSETIVPRRGWWIIVAAYCLSAGAALMHFYAAATAGVAPSQTALQALTVGFVALIIALFVLTRGQPGRGRAVWAVALAVFAVSALHLSYHSGQESWFVELIGHHASLPLALAILYQDYRFAFADLFLKRALALLMLVAVIFGLYITIAAPLLAMRDTRGQSDPRAVGVLLGLWVAIALVYPALRRAGIWFVDAVVLRRADYDELRAEIARLIAACEAPELVLSEVAQALAPALSAHEVRWLSDDAPDVLESAERTSVLSKASKKDEAGQSALLKAQSALTATTITAQISAPPIGGYVKLLQRRPAGVNAVVFIPTTESPHFVLVIGELAGGRRLFSDDIAMLETIAVMVARHIDSLRVTHERCEQVQREQEISKLATEAQLRALQAQINPHFLFNALTTIGYLINAAPERALDTLMRLTDLLRRVLRSTGEFATLGEELSLIESYLDIERARFEERLQVTIDVPAPLREIRLPSLLIQPLVENAIKHGIAQSRFGGEVIISARLERDGASASQQIAETLCITVRDTGVGAGPGELSEGRRRGLGLANVEQRLKSYYGQSASLCIASVPGTGTTIEIKLIVAEAGRQSILSPTTTAALGRERKRVAQP